MQPTRDHAKKFLKLLDAGLVSGLGSPEEGKMCIEAAWCRALDLPHGDNPNLFDPNDQCIGPPLRSAKITLNDSSWSSNTARAKGLRAAGLAQMGSAGIDLNKWVGYYVEQTIRRIVPLALRSAASIHPQQKFKDSLENAAKQCEAKGTNADAAARAAGRAADAAYAAARAGDAAYAADAAADAAARAAYAADAAYRAGDAAYAADAARAACAAYAADAYRAACADADLPLIVSAQIFVEACILCETGGSKWLDMLSPDELLGK